MVQVTPVSQPVVTVKSPDGNTADVIAIPFGAIAWGSLADGGQFKILFTSNTPEIALVGDIVGKAVDTLASILKAVGKILSSTCHTELTQQFQDGKLVGQTFTTNCGPA
jgi:hypothetical protein